MGNPQCGGMQQMHILKRLRTPEANVQRAAGVIRWMQRRATHNVPDDRRFRRTSGTSGERRTFGTIEMCA
jgi:hypothetical protein